MWRDLFNLKEAPPPSKINQRILADATVSGTNLIVLVMAIMIACVGLNMNSVAVIIGAMLISPLMGGIVAIGYGMATYDVHFIRQSMIKLAFQVGFAILTASSTSPSRRWPTRRTSFWHAPRLPSGMSSSPCAAALQGPSAIRVRKRAMSSPA